VRRHCGHKRHEGNKQSMLANYRESVCFLESGERDLKRRGKSRRGLSEKKKSHTPGKVEDLL